MNQPAEPYHGPISLELASLHPVLQRIYAARNIQSLNEIDYSLNRLLHFKDLKNAIQAAELLAKAIQDQKRILIVGDFDTDGATSTTLVVLALRQFGAHHVDYIVPNRFEYGYGLSPEIVAIAKDPDIIITVDNGISSHLGVLAAKEKGISVLITDHHLPPEVLPEADVIVNPQQPGDLFQSKSLAGVGVAFYVMVALRDTLQKMNWFQSQSLSYPRMDHLLDLVALGTVADMVPLDFNNRILITHGLRRICAGKACFGIQALAKVVGGNLKYCTASYLSFSIAPRLNAAGRLQDMTLGIECLLSDDQKEALRFATELDMLNKKRRVIEQKMQQKALEEIMRLNILATQASICLFDKKWHQGVTGLVAGRIKEKFHKPTIVFAPGHQSGELKGSARSIVGIHIRDILADIATQHPHLLSRFGGHAVAAGLSLLEKDYHQFVTIFEQSVKKIVEAHSKIEVQHTDGELHPNELNLALALLIREAGPWGQGFPEPLFEGHFDLLSQRLVGERHLQITLRYPTFSRSLKGILFNVDLNEWPNLRAHSVRLLYRLMVNEWEERRDIQLQVEKMILVNH